MMPNLRKQTEVERTVHHICSFLVLYPENGESMASVPQCLWKIDTNIKISNLVNHALIIYRNTMFESSYSWKEVFSTMKLSGKVILETDLLMSTCLSRVLQCIGWVTHVMVLVVVFAVRLVVSKAVVHLLLGILDEMFNFAWSPNKMRFSIG